MKSLICFIPCGLTDLCIIACPNNRALGQGVVLECQGDPELADDNIPMKVEFADKPELPRKQVQRTCE